jgi:hypothetical protein
MANILIANLNPAGFDLFSDSESYMADIADSDLGQVNGGFTGIPSWGWIIITATLGF